jgi:formylmethanofuran dehydrogenase subunit C
MSDIVTVWLRAPLTEPLQVEGLTADRVAGLSECEIAALPAWLGDRKVRLGDFFEVKGQRSDRLRVVGALTNVNGVAAGMAGGELLIDGDGGRGVAQGMTGGLVVVGGDVGVDAARSMNAGTLVVFGRTGERAGRGSKHGSIVALGGIELPVTYWYACTYEPPHVRLLLTYLRRQYGMKIDDRMIGGRYRRHCGDAGNPGRGEILEWVQPALSGDVADQ